MSAGRSPISSQSGPTGRSRSGRLRVRLPSQSRLLRALDALGLGTGDLRLAQSPTPIPNPDPDRRSRTRTTVAPTPSSSAACARLLVTTAGFEDLLWLRRQDRAALYDLAKATRAAGGSRDLIGVRERMARMSDRDAQ